MKLELKLIMMLIVFGILTACNSCKSDDDVQVDDPQNTEEPGDSEISEAALKLLNNLKQNANQGNILLGHQSTTLAGANGWRFPNVVDYSDFKGVSGKFPAVYGWDFANLPNNYSVNVEGVSYNDLIQEGIKAYNRVGINTYVLHPYRLDNNQNSWNATPGLVAKMIPGGELHNAYKMVLDHYVTEFKKLKDNSNNPIPFIFRPYHEANHNWFWWGSTACTDEEYKILFRFTVEYMRGNGLNNMLVCYAPGYFQNESTYLARYPGDDVVDILGFDGYLGNDNGTDWNTLKNHLTSLSALGQSKNKPIVWAETGEKTLDTNDYFSQLDAVITDSNVKLSYIMFWANYQMAEYYVPFEDLNNPIIRTNFINFIGLNKYQAEGEHTNLYE